MKFGDKLIVLRKKNGLSQEELAEKLGVSRQSVSKWESNNTYPETDKIVQICNIFDCSMDDLINDKVTDIESTLRKNKNNIQNIWDSLLEFITDTVNMFSSMNFSSGLKCIIEMIILGLLLGLFGHIICGIASSLIANIFTFLSNNRVNTIREVLDSIFNLIWFIMAFIVLIHAFKLRYLNNYQSMRVENKSNSKNDKIKDSSSDDKVIKNDKPFEFLNVLAQIVILFIKIMAFFILIDTVFASVGLTVGIVIMLSLVTTHILFLWIALLLLALTVISVQVTILLISFIFNKKVNLKTNLIVFVTTIVIMGISIGLIALTFKNIDYVRDNKGLRIKTEEIELKYKDNLVIEKGPNGTINNYKYIIDNNLEDDKIFVSREIDSRYFKLSQIEKTNDTLPVISINQTNIDDMQFIKEFYLKNLKENKIYTLEKYGNDPLIIKANEKTINKLIENTKKLYLIEEQKNNNEIDIIVHDSKVHFKYGLKGEYNALNDTITYEEEGYTCKKELSATPYGERTIYICDYEEED